MHDALKTLLVLLLVLVPALFLGLGERPVYKIQEVRIAETAREMLESGEWVVPRFNGELRLQKPPLPYWLTAASYRLAGADAVATRLPAALAGLGLALLIWAWTRRELGVEAAGNAAIVLVLSYLGLRYFRSGEADALLLLCIGAACRLGFDIVAHGRREPFRRLLFGLALGLGFLTKGPAGLSIPLLALAGLAFAERRRGGGWRGFAALFSAPGVAAMLIAAFGWYAWIFGTLPDAAQLFFGRQIDETFISGNHPKPLWWYLSNGFGFFAPWSVLLLPAGWLAYRRRGAAMPALARFAWIWLATVFVLLTATINKQMQYALLFAPPLAILIGHYLAVAEGGFLKLNRVLFAALCLAVVAGVVFVLRRTAELPSPLWLALPVAPLALGWLAGVRRPSPPMLLAAGLVAMAFLFSEAHLSKEPHKVAAQALMREAAALSPLYQAGPRPGRGELSFYAGRVVPPVDAADLPALLEKHPEIGFVGETVPSLPEVSVEPLGQADDLRLVRLTRRPRADAATQ